MRIIFCDNGFSPHEVDYMYQEEYGVAKDELLPISLISFEAIKKGKIEAAIKWVKAADEKTIGLYRGWMLKPFEYELLYNLLLEKNIQLINDPTAYKHCHYLPENYEAIKDFTPKSAFKKLDGVFSINDFKEELSLFDNKPVIVKDYVKSQKHYWKEACFIPDASDAENATTIIEKFIELQADDFNEGLVFREFLELEALTNHSISGMPLTKEYRLFIKNGHIIAAFNYWDEGNYENTAPGIEHFAQVIKAVKSNFFTMDIAKKKDGEWIIVELGDAQVAGLPDNADKALFYSQLKLFGPQ